MTNYTNLRAGVMMMQSSKAVILGTRGSVPVHTVDVQRYGGATTCIFLRLAGQPVILDAGTGLLDLPAVLTPEENHLPMLLSHSHVDHLLGLPMCRTLFDPAVHLCIYAKTRYGMDAKAQLSALMSPPLWPVASKQLPAVLTFHEMEQQFVLGPVTVDTLEGIHPGGVTLLRLTGGGKRVVFMTDCTLTESLLPAVTEFARDCDLLLCDGQYSDEEWAERRTFGHSTWNMAARLAAACGAKQARIIHHDPRRTDEELDTAGEILKSIHPDCAFAKAGEEIIL